MIKGSEDQNHPGRNSNSGHMSEKIIFRSSSANYHLLVLWPPQTSPKIDLHPLDLRTTAHFSSDHQSPRLRIPALLLHSYVGITECSKRKQQLQAKVRPLCDFLSKSSVGTSGLHTCFLSFVRVFLVEKYFPCWFFRTNIFPYIALPKK